MTIKSISTYLILLLSLILLTGCGFHLRSKNSYPKELDYLYIQSTTPFGEFEQALRNTLSNSSINLVDSPDQATAILVINSNNVSTASNNVSSNTQLREYTINVAIVFSVLTKKGAVAVPQTTIALSNEYTASINQVLGGDMQADNLKQQMLQNAAFRLSLMLSSELTREGFAKAEKNTKVIK